MCELLERNSTLTRLNLKSDSHGYSERCRQSEKQIDETVNHIREEGAKALGKALMINTTLTQLNLCCLLFCCWIND